MNRNVVSLLSVATLAVSGYASAQSETPGSNDLFPPDAKPGQCYARVFVPPTYTTETVEMNKRDSSKRLEILPAEYKTENETVLVKAASQRLEVIPATYGWEEEQVLVKEASTELVAVPAVYETVSEQILEKAATQVWKKGKRPYSNVENMTGEIMCLVEEPAVYRTVTKQVLKTPATTRQVEIPAVYKTVRRQVMKTPPTTRVVEIPEETAVIPVRKVVNQARATEVVIPGEKQTVTRTVKVTDGRMEWLPILCETNMTTQNIMTIQRALQAAGHYEGPIDGIVGTGTITGIESYQRAKGLAGGAITLDTLKALGISM